MGKRLIVKNADYSANCITNSYARFGVIKNNVLSITSNSGGRVNVNDSSKGRRMILAASEDSNNFFGIYVPEGKTITLKGVEGIRLDYCYLSAPEIQKVDNNTYGRNPNLVGTGSDYVSANYFPLNSDGLADEVSVENNYGFGYYFAFTCRKIDNANFDASSYSVDYIISS